MVCKSLKYFLFREIKESFYITVFNFLKLRGELSGNF